MEASSELRFPLPKLAKPNRHKKGCILEGTHLTHGEHSELTLCSWKQTYNLSGKHVYYFFIPPLYVTLPCFPPASTRERTKLWPWETHERQRQAVGRTHILAHVFPYSSPNLEGTWRKKMKCWVHPGEQVQAINQAGNQYMEQELVSK